MNYKRIEKLFAVNKLIAVPTNCYTVVVALRLVVVVELPGVLEGQQAQKSGGFVAPALWVSRALKEMLGGVAGLAAVGAVVGVLGRLDPDQVGIQERAVS